MHIKLSHIAISTTKLGLKTKKRMRINAMMDGIKEFSAMALLFFLFTSAIDGVMITPTGYRVSSMVEDNSGDRAYDGLSNTYALTGNGFEAWMLFIFPSNQTFKSVDIQGILPPSTEFRCGEAYEPMGRGDTKHNHLKRSVTSSSQSIVALSDFINIDLPRCVGSKVLVKNLNGTASIKINELKFNI
ncbi:unnamed protein product [Owenia fusiformis]|uniref:Uncharacterized protein n=1 Tax=Owenia fusiformis TaxID=6347 RepID=A0A8S4N5W2_OWEFU|nr:unnamed protein product [Owenia fusiformis]